MKLMTHYLKKQISILGILVLIIAVIGFGIYFLIKPPKATCYDNIQNQGENGIDCGGPCGQCDKPQELSVIYQNFILTTENNFDLVAKVENPNSGWAVESMVYTFNIYKGEDLLLSKEGRIYILPQETKHIIEQKIFLNETPDRVEIKFKDISWQKIKNLEDLEIRIKNENREILPESGFNRLLGVVENKSDYDFDKIEIIGVLLSNDKIVAVGKTEIRTVVRGESRYFEMNWPYEISDEITSFELRTHTNIFLNDNFIKTHGTMEKFKGF